MAPAIGSQPRAAATQTRSFIASAMVVTEIRPLLTRRMGQPDDIAQVIAYLVSPRSRQVTAAEWSVDGGAQRHI
jgi:NAD(P)-dependent dehydrogenase (short-subunit alcohol dehydrogenase family)